MYIFGQPATQATVVKHTRTNCTVYKIIYDVAEQKSIGYFRNALIKNSAVPKLLYAIELIQQIPSQPISTPKTLIDASSCFSANLTEMYVISKDAFHLINMFCYYFNECVFTVWL